MDGRRGRGNGGGEVRSRLRALGCLLHRPHGYRARGYGLHRNHRSWQRPDIGLDRGAAVALEDQPCLLTWPSKSTRPRWSTTASGASKLSEMSTLLPSLEVFPRFLDPPVVASRLC